MLWHCCSFSRWEGRWSLSKQQPPKYVCPVHVGASGDQAACVIPHRFYCEECWRCIYFTLHSEHRFNILQCFWKGITYFNFWGGLKFGVYSFPIWRFLHFPFVFKKEVDMWGKVILQCHWSFITSNLTRSLALVDISFSYVYQIIFYMWFIRLCALIWSSTLINGMFIKVYLIWDNTLAQFIFGQPPTVGGMVTWLCRVKRIIWLHYGIRQGNWLYLVLYCSKNFILESFIKCELILI